MKKFLVTMLAVAMAIGVAGCGGGEKKAADTKAAGGAATTGFYKGKNVTMIVPWSAGGGSDNGARLLVPYVEKKLGCTITVTNPTGGSGWVGWQQMLTGKPDGLTISLVNWPTLLSGYLNPKMKRKYTVKDFQLIANHVTDDSVIALNKNEKRFTDMKSLIEYAKKNEVTFGTTGPGTDDSILMNQLNAALGTKFKEVASKGWADNSAAIQGGHIDVTAGNVSEVKALYEGKELKVVAIFADKENPLLKGVPTFNSMNLGTKIINSSQRGYATKAGIPAGALKELADAFKDAINDKEQIKKMADIGLRVDYMDPEAYGKMVQEEETTMKGMSKIMGWTK